MKTFSILFGCIFSLFFTPMCFANRDVEIAHFFFPALGKTTGTGLLYANYLYVTQSRGDTQDVSLFKTSGRYTTENLNAFGFFTNYSTPSQARLLLSMGYDRNYNWRYTQTGGTYFSTAYLSYDTSVKVSYLKKINPILWVGPFVGIQNKVMEDHRINATIKSQQLSGSLGGTQFGIGGNVLVAKRDKVFNTRSGYAVLYTTRYFNERLGGHFNYLTHQVDIKHYTPVAKNAIFAWQVNLDSTIDYQNTGIPFYALPRLGGRSSIRGIPTDFIQAPYAAFARAEYREYTVKGRFGMALFSELGAYSYTWHKLPNLIPCVGAGLKYQVGKSEGVHLALDGGLSSLGWAVTLGFGDAF